MAHDEEFAIIFRDASRFWIQRVVVPILVCIGAVGNIVSIIVLTRRKMRSSTNAYLTALAVSDVIFLFFVLILSFKHYPNIHDRKYELYWRFYGISHWLCDAASSSSVWLTVSFTIERYIVVCHPIKGKVLCTERRAKTIIAAVFVLCLTATITTAFEHHLLFEEICAKVCDESDLEVLQPKRAHEIKQQDQLAENLDLTLKTVVETNCSSVQFYNYSKDEGPPLTEEALSVFVNATNKFFNGLINMVLLNTTCCNKAFSVTTGYTNLGNNRTYRIIMYWFSSIFFGVLPLALIATFNCFLVSAVYKSLQQRNLMTNSQEKTSQSQENRITLLLIAIVALFLICQIPTSSFLIYDVVVEDDPNDFYTQDIKTGLGNIFNSLITLNASCNFILYCVLSDKYRKTFKALFLKRNLNNLDDVSLRGSRHSLRFNDRRLLKRGLSDYTRTPRNLETRSLNSIPRSKSLIQRPLGKAKTSDLIV